MTSSSVRELLSSAARRGCLPLVLVAGTLSSPGCGSEPPTGAPADGVSDAGVMETSTGVDAGPRGDQADGGTDADDSSTPLAGAVLWAKGFGSTAGVHDQGDTGLSVDVDAAGNVLVLGTFAGAAITFGGTPTLVGGQTQTAFLVKLDPAGNVLWSRGFKGENLYVGGLTHDATSAYIGLNFANTLAFGTQTFSSTGREDFALIKLDGAGNVTASKRFGGTENENVQSIAVGPGGILAAAGSFDRATDLGGGTLTAAGPNGAPRNLYVMKLDTSFGHVWSRSFPSSSPGAGALAVDPAGNVLAAGSFGESIDFGTPVASKAGDVDGFVVSLAAATGQPRWSHTYGGVGATSFGSLELGSSGTVYLAASSSGSVDFGGGPLLAAAADGPAGGAILALDAAGTHLWSKRYGGVWLNHLALAPSGALVLCGVADKPTAFDGTAIGKVGYGEGFILELGAGGAYRWSKPLGGLRPNAVATDASGSAYATGEFYYKSTVPAYPTPISLTSTGDGDAFVTKLSL